MRGQLHLAADLDVEVAPQPIDRVVILRALEGVDYGQTDPATTRKEAIRLVLNKGEARALASLIMGCAAEL